MNFLLSWRGEILFCRHLAEKLMTWSDQRCSLLLRLVTGSFRSVGVPHAGRFTRIVRAAPAVTELSGFLYWSSFPSGRLVNRLCCGFAIAIFSSFWSRCIVLPFYLCNTRGHLHTLTCREYTNRWYNFPPLRCTQLFSCFIYLLMSFSWAGFCFQTLTSICSCVSCPQWIETLHIMWTFYQTLLFLCCGSCPVVPAEYISCWQSDIAAHWLHPAKHRSHCRHRPRLLRQWTIFQIRTWFPASVACSMQSGYKEKICTMRLWESENISVTSAKETAQQLCPSTLSWRELLPPTVQSIAHFESPYRLVAWERKSCRTAPANHQSSDELIRLPAFKPPIHIRKLTKSGTSSKGMRPNCEAAQSTWLAKRLIRIFKWHISCWNWNIQTLHWFAVTRKEAISPRLKGLKKSQGSTETCCKDKTLLYSARRCFNQWREGGKKIR